MRSKMEGVKKSKIDRNIRQCLSYCIKNNGPLRWSIILGFTKEEFLKHLEKEFQPGMTMENYGEKWVISFHIPKRCYVFKSIRDEDFSRFYSLKNIKPCTLEEAQHQKKRIKKSEIEKYGLWDILPTGNFARFLDEDI